MASTVFFSWQSDTPNRVGRGFLERALTAALALLAGDGELEEAAREVELDRDTKDVAGSPPVVDTIFGKIDAAAAVVCDVTFVATRGGGKSSPNPNVLIEYGWALKSRAHSRVITVMNAAFGAPSEVSLPFDMRHLRWPVTYDLPSDAPAERKSAELKRLTNILVEALKPVLGASPPAAPRTVFPRRASGRTPGRWQGADQVLGMSDYSDVEIKAPNGPLMWFRMSPKFDQGHTWSGGDIRGALWARRAARPFTAPTGGFWRLRGDGFVGQITRSADPSDMVGYWASALFENGELWGFDGYRMGDWAGQIAFDPEEWARAIAEYGTIMSELDVAGPVVWEAGFEDCRGRRFGAGRGPCLREVVTVEGAWGEGGAEAATKAIFNALVEATS